LDFFLFRLLPIASIDRYKHVKHFYLFIIYTAPTFRRDFFVVDMRMPSDSDNDDDFDYDLSDEHMKYSVPVLR
jgi:hypothetical protein